MKAIVTLGLGGGILFAVRGWISLLLVVWVAGRISHGLAMALFKECLKAGWFDEARCRGGNRCL
jgi:hypothetical protein